MRRIKSASGSHLFACVVAALAFAWLIDDASAQTRGARRPRSDTPAQTQGQTPAQSRIAVPAKTVPENGLYFANDALRFLIDHANNQVRLRFLGNDEVFYLSSEPANLGGRLLKYDTGDTALMIAGWGGVTLYTESEPNGLPAERTGDGSALDPQLVGGSRIKRFAAELSQSLSDRFNIAIGFAANWEKLAKDDHMRALASESMRNAAQALEHLVRERGGRTRVARISIVRVVEGPTPAVKTGGNILTVVFAPDAGANAAQAVGPTQALAGRPSSLAIAKALMSAR